ncbi:hypothetical protein [Cellvibrio sp. BR]|uniref:hypothetical protein n=1 Tax=Cellvibrio sp. BR TaxID=1134474 RepID=UPI0018DEE8C0|nr:hypothetical protein [Cellvibrio sp. BR]
MNKYDYSFLSQDFFTKKFVSLKHLVTPAVTAATCSLLVACGGGGGGGNNNSSPASSSATSVASSVSSSASSVSSSLSSLSASSLSVSSLSLSSSSLSSVSLSSLSSAPSSTSSVSSSAVAVSSANSSSSSIGDATAISIISPPGAASARVAIDDQGNAWAIWKGIIDGASGGDNLIANRYVKGSGWGTAQLLENDGASVDKAEIYIDPSSGRAVATWTQLTSAGAYDLWVRRYAPATGWAEPERIENSEGAMGFFAKTIIDSNGNALAVWAQSPVNLGRFSIWSSHYTAAAGWSEPVLLEDNNVIGGQDGSPSLAWTGDGKALVVWLNSGNNRVNIATNSYTAAGGWAEDEILVADTGGDMVLNHPLLVNDGAGKALLVWGQWNSLGDGTFTSRILAKSYNNGWSDDIAVVGEDPGSDLVSAPRAASNGSGVAAVTWARKNQAVMANIRAANGTWGTQSILKPGNADFLQSVPEVAIDGAANGLLVWSQESNDNTSKDSWFANLSGSTGSWASGQLLEAFVGTAVEPIVAANNAGDRVVVWYNFNSFGSPGSEIYARYFPAGTTAAPVPAED